MRSQTFALPLALLARVRFAGAPFTGSISGEMVV